MVVGVFDVSYRALARVASLGVAAELTVAAWVGILVAFVDVCNMTCGG